MKNKLLAFVLAVLIALPCFSQMKAGMTIGPQFPVGDFSSASFGAGFGLGASGEYFFKDNMSTGILLHYSSFNQRGFVTPGFFYNSYDARMGVTSFTFLFNYYFSGAKVKPFIGGEFGLFAVRYHFHYTYVQPKFGFIVAEKGTDINTYAGMIIPAAGIAYPVNDKLDMTANMKYSIIFGNDIGYDNIAYIGINFGVFYKIAD